MLHVILFTLLLYIIMAVDKGEYVEIPNSFGVRVYV